MALIRLIPTKSNLQFTRYRYPAYLLSGLLVLLTVLLLFGRGLNYGVDFRGGLALELRFSEAVTADSIRGKLEALQLSDLSLQQFGSNQDYMLIAPVTDESAQAAQQLQERILASLGNNVEVRRSEYVGPRVGAELKKNGILAVGFALFGIMCYIWLRFEWQFGVCALIALLHDCITTIGLFILLQLEFNLSTIAAVLTIAGYSINDTVVIYDRIRENLRKYKKMPLHEVIDLSLNETLSRTILTVTTVLIVLLILLFLGGEVISGFAIAMLWGLFVGTYSTVYLAAPLLAALNVRRTLEASDENAAVVG
ncbi:MAG: protein translocase subunit SecF [Alphaproteobacteria bacterium]|jgi:preprotein translocase subunit SecF|nr:protein translocase subunit SecF [Thalassospira sp.]MCE2964813.1 protein translocase subunit SecF [Alphaproteobacteria bacterium]